jgi:hypothetical protein
MEESELRVGGLLASMETMSSGIRRVQRSGGHTNH